ncbi:MAG: hypothetical protein ACFBWO_11850 [Paracoccaceae bacterium]
MRRRAVSARWRECLAAGALGLFGLALVLGWLGATPATALVGLAFLLAGGGWLAAAARRALVARRGARGPGLVAVREGAVAYFGPARGGVLALDALDAVEIVREDGAAWRLRGEDGTTLDVPAGAEGAPALADALVTLPGFRAGTARRALESGAIGEAAVTVWSRHGGAEGLSGGRPARLGAPGDAGRPVGLG